MTTTETVLAPAAPAVPVESNVLVVAEHPSELEAAQGSLKAWASSRIAALTARKEEAEKDLASAKSHKWRAGPFRKVVAEIENELEYMDKMQFALDQGYCIVPNFPVDIIAIRIREGVSPGSDEATSTWGYRGTSDFEQSADVLPAGEGTYVDKYPSRWTWKDTGKDAQGKAITTYHARPRDFRAPSFPVHMAKPRVLDATQRAMALRCFDRIGCLPGRKRKADPIVVGQIFRANRTAWDRGNDQHNAVVTFLIAWWVDTRDLSS